ncbi:uncharacterized protein METZ01_LOCUS176793, partial [marine metagenome]
DLGFNVLNTSSQSLIHLHELESIELLKFSIWILPFLVKTELYVVSLISVCVKNFPVLNLEQSLSIELQELNRSRVTTV